jgi:hypothetical protein
MDDAGTPQGTLFVRYDRASEPRTFELVLDGGGFGLEGVGYAFSGYADGSGTFAYAFRNARGDLLVVEAGFDAAGAGRANVAFAGALGGTGSFRQCWDASACLVFVDDPLNLSCDELPGEGCSAGAETACPAVPASPF